MAHRNNTLLFIPDYPIRGPDWESGKPYLQDFAHFANRHDWTILVPTGGRIPADFDAVLALNYAHYVDSRHGIDIPKLLRRTQKPAACFISETPSRRPDLWENTARFDICFSFSKDPDRHCLCRHVHHAYPYNFELNQPLFITWKDRGLISWAAANNWYPGTDSLSATRLIDFAAIAQLDPRHSALFGRNWGVLPSGRLLRLLLRKPRLALETAKAFSYARRLYRGVPHNKHEAISRYKFNLAYENSDNHPGYVTEKVFDAWFAGSVPVYLGDEEFESQHSSLLLCPRHISRTALKKTILALDETQAISINRQFQEALATDVFSRYSHKHFQKAILKTLTEILASG